MKATDLLAYVEGLPESDPVRARLTTDKMLALRKNVETLTVLDGMIRELRADVKAVGLIEVYKNGAQETRRVNPAADLHIRTLGVYMQVFKQTLVLLDDARIKLEKEW